MSNTAKKVKQPKTIESYYQTSDEWHNEHIIEIITCVKETDIFQDVSIPLELFNLGFDSFLSSPSSPLKTIRVLEKEFEKLNLNDEQIIFVLDSLVDYLDKSTFEDDEDDTQVDDETKDTFWQILKADLKRRKKEYESIKPKKLNSDGLRAELKTMFEKELRQIPEYLDKLEPKEKLNFIHKMMPFVLPKVDSVVMWQGERDYD